MQQVRELRYVSICALQSKPKQKDASTYRIAGSCAHSACYMHSAACGHSANIRHMSVFSFAQQRTKFRQTLRKTHTGHLAEAHTGYEQVHTQI